MLEARDLSAGYHQEIILHQLNMVFGSHGISFVAGVNGVGKSLLLRLLSGFLIPQKGRIIQHQEKYPALMHQKPILLNRSVRDNLLFILQAEQKNTHQKDTAQTEIDKTLEATGLMALSDKNALSLSVGQQKLLSFAMVLVMQRDYWLLDEPTASLAPDAKEMVENLLISARAEGQKMVIVSHEAQQIKRLAGKDDDILFLSHETEKADRIQNHYIMKVNEFFENPPHSQAMKFINHV